MKQQTATNKYTDMLSRRECSIISYLAEGYTHEQIGEKTGLDAFTIQQYLQDMMRKQGALHSYELISLAYRNGFLT